MYIYYSKWGFVQLDFIIQHYRKINTRTGLSKKTEKSVHCHFQQSTQKKITKTFSPLPYKLLITKKGEVFLLMEVLK